VKIDNPPPAKEIFNGPRVPTIGEIYSTDVLLKQDEEIEEARRKEIARRQKMTPKYNRTPL